MKLELKHIQSYPIGPDGIKVKINEKGLSDIGEYIYSLEDAHGVWWIKQIDFQHNVLLLWNDNNAELEEVELDWIQLVLNPLDSLTKEIEHKGEKISVLKILADKIWNHTINYPWYFTDSEYVIKEMIRTHDRNELPYWMIEVLAEYHLDFQYLIPTGLAVGIKTLQKRYE